MTNINMLPIIGLLGLILMKNGMKYLQLCDIKKQKENKQKLISQYYNSVSQLIG